MAAMAADRRVELGETDATDSSLPVEPLSGTETINKTGHVERSVLDGEQKDDLEHAMRFFFGGGGGEGRGKGEATHLGAICPGLLTCTMLEPTEPSRAR